MMAIHRMVLRRLFIAWLIVSLAATAAVYLVELSRFNDAIVAVVGTQAEKLAAKGLEIQESTPEQLKMNLDQAREFMARNFVVIEIFDRADRSIARVVNPNYTSLEQEAGHARHALPHDGSSHFKKLSVEKAAVIQVVVPLPSRSGGLAGHLEGLFVLDPITQHTFRQQLWRTLAAVLLSVLATTIILYPIIISLNRSVIRTSRKILIGNLEMASALGTAIAKRDSETGEHNFRVTLYAIGLGERAGIHKDGMLSLILGAFLHDVGKIGIPDHVLLKPGRLDAEEFQVMRTHVGLGVDIIAHSEWLGQARAVVECHHEKYDGSGYPKGLKGGEIPMNARIFAIVDVFDALTSRRPYKEPMTVAEALDIIQRGAGSHFDPNLVAGFLEIAAEAHGEISLMNPAELAAELRRHAIRYFLDGEEPPDRTGPSVQTH